MTDAAKGLFGGHGDDEFILHDQDTPLRKAACARQGVYIVEEHGASGVLECFGKMDMPACPGTRNLADGRADLKAKPLDQSGAKPAF